VSITSSQSQQRGLPPTNNVTTPPGLPREGSQLQLMEDSPEGCEVNLPELKHLRQYDDAIRLAFQLPQPRYGVRTNRDRSKDRAQDDGIQQNVHL